MVLVDLVRRRIAEHGVVWALRKSLCVGYKRISSPPDDHSAPTVLRTPIRDAAVLCLNLQPGEWVEVKSLEEITETLDANEKCQGLTFTREMADYCGKRFRVFKRLELLFNEYTREQRKVKNTVLLESVYCKGTGFGCDRCCYHFWREAWLRRVPTETDRSR
jgi:hypothetical protein